jgi:hypothetical protein
MRGDPVAEMEGDPGPAGTTLSLLQIREELLVDSYMI